MKKIIVLLFMVQAAFALETETEVILPPVFLEIEDITVENVNSDLPFVYEDMVKLPEIELDLPDPVDTEISDFEIENIVNINEEAVLVEIDEAEVDDGIYSFDGVVGFGSLLNPFGAFTVSRLSSEHRYTLGLSHDSKDGFGFNKIGNQYSEREDNLFFDYQYKDNKYINNLNFSFTDFAFGLQDGFNSENIRNYNLTNLFNFHYYELYDLVFDLGLSVSEDGDYVDVLFEPTIEANFSFPSIKYNVGISYALNYANNINNYFNLYTDFDIELPEAVNFAAGVGLFWSDSDNKSIYSKDLKGISIPFFLTIYGNVKDYMAYSFSGGFENEIQRYDEMKFDYRYLEQGQYNDLSGWFADAQLDFKIKQYVDISVGIDFNKKTGYVVTDNSMQNSRGFFDYDSDILQLLYLNAGVVIKPIDLVTIELEWIGELLEDDYYLVPEHQLNFLLTYKIPENWFGGDFSLDFEVYKDSYIPDLGLNMFFNVNKNVSINIDASDLLAGIYTNGRPTIWGSYIAPGTNVSVSAKIKF